MSLYQLEKQYQEIINNLYDKDTGEINEAALIELNLNETLTQDKAVALIKWTRNMAVEMTAIEEARSQMQKRKKALEGEIERWEGQIFEAMKKRGIDKISCPYFVIDIVKNPSKPDITDKEILPDKYIKRVVEESVDRIALRKDLVDGEIVPGAQLVQTERLRIK